MLSNSTWTGGNRLGKRTISNREFYVIETADDLRSFCEIVNAGAASANGMLVADIDLNPMLNPKDKADRSRCKGWTPIGTYSLMYNGIFKGGGYTVSGVFIETKNTAGYLGLFGAIGKSAEIRGVTVDGRISPTKNFDLNSGGTLFVGGVAGSSEGLIDECVNMCDIIGKTCVGGVCGNNSGIISNCINKGTVAGRVCTGGVCGRSDGDLVSKCINKPAVIGEKNTGGICGFNRGTLRNCVNEGFITGREKTGAVSGRLCKGAVVEGCTDMSDFGSEFGYIHKEAKVLSNIDQPTQSDQSPDPRADKVRWRCCENVFCWQYKILRY